MSLKTKDRELVGGTDGVRSDIDGNIWASLYDVVPASRRGAAVGLMNMIAWLGGGLGAYLIGAAAVRGVTMSAAISSTAIVYVFVAALLLLAGLRYAPRDVEANAERHELTPEL